MKKTIKHFTYAGLEMAVEICWLNALIFGGYTQINFCSSHIKGWQGNVNYKRLSTLWEETNIDSSLPKAYYFGWKFEQKTEGNNSV